MKAKTVANFIICPIVVLVIVVLSISTLSHAASIKTRIFLKDLNKAQQQIDNEYNALMEFLDVLTEKEVKAFNDYGVSSPISPEIYNKPVITTFNRVAKLCQFQETRLKRVSRNGIMLSFIQHYDHVGKPFNYFYIIGILGYGIDPGDTELVINKCSNYYIDYLDKVQQLYDKTTRIGLKANLLGKCISNQRGRFYLPYMTRKVTAGMVHRWKDSAKEFPELHSNKAALTALKLWIEFVLNNELYDVKGSAEEQYMIELDKIEKRLAEIAGAPQKEDVKTAPRTTEALQTEPLETEKKNKFKLDLPE